MLACSGSIFQVISSNMSSLYRFGDNLLILDPSSPSLARSSSFHSSETSSLEGADSDTGGLTSPGRKQPFWRVGLGDSYFDVWGKRVSQVEMFATNEGMEVGITFECRVGGDSWWAREGLRGRIGL